MGYLLSGAADPICTSACQLSPSSCTSAPKADPGHNHAGLTPLVCACLLVVGTQHLLLFLPFVT